MRRIIVLFCLFSSLGLYAAEHVKVAPDEVLFLAHFNSKSGFETGNGEDLINNAEITSGNGGFPFKNSSPATEALNIAGKGRFFSICTEGNFNPERGTLQFMVKPQWGTSGYNHCVIFHLVFNRDRRDRYAWDGVNSFYIQKPPEKEWIEFTQDGNHAFNVIAKNIHHPYKKHVFSVRHPMLWSTDTTCPYYAEYFSQ